jgi:hypothetical protein
MATTTQLHVVKNALADALALLPALSGVQIGTAYLGDESALESIQFRSPDRAVQNWVHEGRLTREEEMTIDGVVWVVKPGKGETIIRAARGRAVELWAAVEGYLRGSTAGVTIENTVLMVTTTAYGTEEGIHPQGRYCQLEFSITAKVRLRV